MANRDAALIRTLAWSGLRLGSAVNLRVEDLDLDRAEMRITRMKGHYPTTLPIAPRLVRALARYIGTRRDGWIFPGSAGQPMTTRHASRRIAIWADRAGLGGKATAHAFRHGFAQSLYDRNQDIALVKEALGHRSLAASAVYARASAGALRRAIRG
jgi:integrase